MIIKDSEARTGQTRCERCGHLATQLIGNRSYCSTCAPASTKSASADPTLLESIDDLAQLHTHVG